MKEISLQDPQVQALRGAREEFIQAEADFRSAQMEIAPLEPLLGLAGSLPSPGPELVNLSHFLNIARDLAGAGRFTAVGLEPTFSLLSAKESGSSPLGNMPQQIIASLAAGQSDLAKAEACVNEATAERSLIGAVNRDGSWGATLASALDQIDRELPALQSTLHTTVRLPQLLDSLFGVSQSKTYLVLGQNNYELRASGGFIGSMGLLTLERGQVAQLDYRSSYSFDNLNRPTVLPPAPLQKYMDIQNWFIRDSNWWPDFPSSAQQAEWFLSLDQGKKVDGVIAIDLIGVRKLLGVIGPVRVEVYNTTVDADNMLDQMWYYIYSPDRTAPEARGQPADQGLKGKAFLTYLFQAVLDKVSQTDLTRAPDLMAALQQALDEKHVLLYLHDPALQAYAAEMNWNGAISVPTDDYLLVDDTNVSYSEVNAFVDEEIKYQVVLGNDMKVDHARVTIGYTNKFDQEATKSSFERFGGHTYRYATGKVENVKGSYGDYVRLYVPKGSRLIGAQGFETSTETWEEQGRTVFGNYISLMPGETEQVTIDYVPPVSANNTGNTWYYRLTVQKQPGTVGHKLGVTVTAPGKVVVPGTDPKMVAENNSAQWETKLSVDRQIEVLFAPAK